MHNYFNKKTTALVLIAIALIAYFMLGNTSTPTPPVEQQTVLTPPERTPEATAAYQATVDKLAVESGTLEVGLGCTMTPLVLKQKEGDTLAVHNSDTVDHTITFEDQNFFAVSAGQTRTIELKTVLSRVAGTYRYRCSDVSTSTNVGVVYVVN